jgi:glycosyltransferase involved in cell wall biosynthesis
MTDEEIAGLYSHPKIKSYVTTTHGEGFGLPIFEASYSGLPVVAPAWSGHMDFLYCPEESTSGKVKNTPHFEKISYDLVPVEEVALMEGIIEPGMQWCEPKFEKTRAALRNVYRGHAYRQKMATDLMEHNKEKFSVENQHKMMCDAVWSTYDSDSTRWKEDNDEIQIL